MRKTLARQSRCHSLARGGAPDIAACESRLSRSLCFAKVVNSRRSKKGTKALTESVEKTATGAMLFDQSIIKNISESMFGPAGWPHVEALVGELRSAGRGQTLYVGNVPRQFVLRHFWRGGLIGKLVRDSFVFTGADNTRSFLEWRMLAKMAEKNLRVPRPAAARYCQHGPFYTADIITVRIPRVRSLSERIAEKAWDETFWQALGAAIHEFHDCGVYHADMNAYNLQIDDNGMLWMLDFDRGRLLPPGAWQQKTLERLHRSLQKVKKLDPRLNYGRANWEQLLDGYFSASRSE
jgi:3-deoxy-D-manno-octulosonic acid kinase